MANESKIVAEAGLQMVTINGRDHLVAIVPIEPRATLTDKGNRTIATTAGNRPANLQYKGMTISYSVNAYVKESA